MTTSHPESRTGARFVAAVSALFGACFFGTVASVNVPYHGSDAEVLAWWQKDSSLTEGMVSMAFAIATAVLFAVVTGHVLHRAGDRSAPLVAFARSMATAFTVTLLVSAALRGVIGHLVNVEERPLPGLDVLDYATALNYTVVSVVVMTCFALTILAIGALVLLTGILARWHGIVGLVLGVVVLAAVAASYGAFTVPLAILWALGTTVAIVRAPALAAATEVREPVGTMAP
jgi:hypothetical protein